MKASRTLKGLLLGLSLLLAASAFAANKGPLQLINPASLGGKQLAAGSYTVKWDGNGPEVQLSVLKGNKVVATAPARLSNLDRSSEGNEAVVNVNADGSRTLTEIRLAGKKYALAIGESSGGGQSGSGSSMR
jgi:hypothetical protein